MAAARPKELILNRGGVGLLPDHAIVNELSSGKLVKLLPDWEIEPTRLIYLVFPDTLRVPARSRALIDFIKSNVDRYLPEGGGQQMA